MLSPLDMLAGVQDVTRARGSMQAGVVVLYQVTFTLELSEKNVRGWRSGTRRLGFNLCVAPLLNELSP